MSAIAVAVFRALGQMADRRFRQLLWRSVALAFAALALASVGMLWLVGIVAEHTGIVWLVQLGSFLGLAVVSVFLIVPLAAGIMSVFVDSVIETVEQRHYPHLPPHTPAPFAAEVMHSLGFFALFVVANLLALAFYVLLAPLAPFIFLGLNGFLLGREYFILVAMRRIGRREAHRVARKHRAAIWITGVLMAIPLSIPLLGLLMPLMGAATFTHLYHRLQKPPVSSEKEPTTA